MILVDTNVLLAALVDHHDHHSASLAILDSAAPARVIVAAHSIAECYNHLTRHGSAGFFRWSGEDATAALSVIGRRFKLTALTAAQTLDAIQRFSALGIGPRLYDYLIGATGALYGATTIVTWNVKDFVPLFPALRVVTPEALASPP